MKNTIIGVVVALFVVSAAFAFSSCATGGEQTKATETQSSETNMDMNHDDGHMENMGSIDSADFSTQRNTQTSTIIDAYQQIQKALEVEKKAEAAAGGKAMVGALEKFDSSKLDEAKRKEYAEIFESAKEHAEHITKSEIGHQKEHFDELTTDLKDLFKLVGTEKKE